ncbi:MAG: hypothetical protein MUE46_02335 [Xanthomonadales bacterium]|nr:hypothetical protein [Xanthomonadales bacterium]
MSATLIINALVVNEGRTVEADVRIRDGRITQIGGGLTCYGDEELVDAACRCLLPGLIEVQTGPVDAQSLSALLAGGVTSHAGLSAAAAGGLLNHADTAPPAADGSAEAVHLLALLEAVLDGTDVLEALVERVIHARARRLRLHERGYVREDAWADLVLIDLAQPGVGADGRAYRASVVGTWVNGEQVWDGERLRDVRPGRALAFTA